MFFDPDEPEGLKGSEGCMILSYAQNHMLSFSWNAPPQFEKSRKEMAQWVVLFFDPIGNHRTVVRLLEFGWKDTSEGEQVYKYFDRAWSVVLARLAYSFTNGPIDWNNPYRPPA